MKESVCATFRGYGDENADCPYCGQLQFVSGEMDQMGLHYGPYRKGEIKVEVNCEGCGRVFIIDECK